MKLLLDIGNTRLKLATFDGQTLSYIKAIEIGQQHSCQTQLTDTLAQLSQPIEACLAVTVASASNSAAIAACIDRCPLHWIEPTASAAGVVNAYPQPEQLGADRWVSMLGLTRHFTAPHPGIVLATFGTATTVDTLSPDNEFKGGLILPGVRMMHQSLAQGTALLPDVAGPITAFPTNTISAIASGVAGAQVGAVLRQIGLAQSTYGQAPLVCVSGGALPSVTAELQRALGATPLTVAPHIVLEGLAKLAATIK